MIVNLKLSIETAKRLGDKAARQGQTLEALLTSVAENEAWGWSNGGSTNAESQEREDPLWRGVFALDYSRQEFFTTEHDVNVNALPPLPAEVHIDARRLADESD